MVMHCADIKWAVMKEACMTECTMLRPGWDSQEGRGTRRGTQHEVTRPNGQGKTSSAAFPQFPQTMSGLSWTYLPLSFAMGIFSFVASFGKNLLFFSASAIVL